MQDRGLDAVTIDDISHDADVSPRTFFNDFVSKEAALVGDGPGQPRRTRSRRSSYGGGGILEDLATMMTASAQTCCRIRRSSSCARRSPPSIRT